MDEHTRKAMEGAGSHLLTNDQKRELCMLAGKAWRAERAAGAAPDPAQDGMPESVAFNVWRRLRQSEALGVASLCDATNADYLVLKRFWLERLGRKAQADRVEARRLGEKYTWVMHRFERELEAARDVLPEGRRYVDGFLRHKRGVSLEQANVQQVWQGIYLLRRRAGQLRRKPQAALHGGQ